MPIYSIDRERESGIPQEALDFKNKINEADAIIISFAEHNGSYTAAFKNINDWVSRIGRGMWGNKPVLVSVMFPYNGRSGMFLGRVPERVIIGKEKILSQIEEDGISEYKPMLEELL